MYLYVLVCYSYVIVCYSFVTRLLLVCYSYVLVWCFSHDQKTSVTEKVLSLNERLKFTSLNRAMSLF